MHDQAPPARRGLQVLVLIVVGAAAVVWGANWLSGVARGVVDSAPTSAAPSDVAPGVAVEVVVPPGASARSIGGLLAEVGVVDSGREFELAARSRGVAESLAAGRYEMLTGMGVEAALAVLEQGPAVETFDVLVREGLRIEEVLAEIAGQTPFTVEELAGALTSGAVTSALLPEEVPDEQPEGALTRWEGLLFPAKYDFRVEATADTVLQRLADEMVQRVNALDFGGIDPYEAVIMASIIEAETRVDADRPLVASVINNRLEQGIPLQIDATVLFAMGERGIGLTFADLETDSPYNTYLHTGLPPTPIGAPGQASLEAVANPAETDFLYYVLTSADGSHSFTADYNEFLRWKEQAKAEGIFP